jgi:hypothetical protein
MHGLNVRILKMLEDPLRAAGVLPAGRGGAISTGGRGCYMSPEARRSRQSVTPTLTPEAKPPRIEVLSS